MLVPFLLTSLLNALNAIQRLGAFLDQDESLDVEIDGSDPGRIVLNDASFCWPTLPKKMKEDEKNTDKGGAPPTPGGASATTENDEEKSGPIQTKKKPMKKPKRVSKKNRKDWTRRKRRRRRKSSKICRIKNRLACRMFPSTSNREV